MTLRKPVIITKDQFLKARFAREDEALIRDFFRNVLESLSEHNGMGATGLRSGARENEPAAGGSDPPGGLPSRVRARGRRRKRYVAE